MPRVQTKSIREAPSPLDGRRILVMSLWPRGVKKSRADEWRRELGTPLELVRKCKGGKITWPRFRHDYLASLKEPAKRESIAELAGPGSQGHNHPPLLVSRRIALPSHAAQKGHREGSRTRSNNAGKEIGRFPRPWDGICDAARGRGGSVQGLVVSWPGLQNLGLGEWVGAYGRTPLQLLHRSPGAEVRMALVPITTSMGNGRCLCICGCQEIHSLRDEETGRWYCQRCAKEHLERNQRLGKLPWAISPSPDGTTSKAPVTGK